MTPQEKTQARRAAMNARQAAIEERKAIVKARLGGTCTRCGAEAPADRKQCEPCAEYSRAAARRTYRRKKEGNARRYYRAARAETRPADLPEGAECTVCAELPGPTAHRCPATRWLLDVPVCADCAKGEFHSGRMLASYCSGRRSEAA